MKAGEEPGKKG